LNLPDKAEVLCVDENTRVQVLDRTDASWFNGQKGHCGTMIHDYKHNGTTCLFSVMKVL